MPRVVQTSAELRRILALPRRPQEHDAELAAELTRYLRRPGGTQVLRPIQATALHELYSRRGLFAPIGVGEGKTLITLLGPLVMSSQAPILVLPAKLLDKTRREMIELNKHWKIPNHIRMYSFEMLGRADHVHLLRRLPLCDLLMADECHKLRNPKAAVSRRFKRFFEEFPDVPFMGLSGSICKRSLRDYEHLLRWALKDGAPLPHVYGELEDWSDALDEHDRERPEPGALVMLSGGDPDLQAVRAGYRSRLIETEGVVASTSNRLGVSLLLRGVRYPQGQPIREALRTLRALMELPDGTELVSGMEVWRYAREMALGFWGRWDPPPPREWLEPRAAWGKVLREILGRSRTLDSELHVIRAIDDGTHPAVRHAAPILEAWRAVKDSFVPNPVPVWIDDAPLEFVEAWGRSHEGIIWTDHVPFAKKLAERTKWSYYGRHGLDENGNALDQHTKGPCIASRQSGAEGFNLQRWSEALVTAIVANDTQTEQLLGRLHRPGQENDVTFDLMIGCREHIDSFWKAHAEARMVYETMGTEQKILYADTDFPHDTIDQL